MQLKGGLGSGVTGELRAGAMARYVKRKVVKNKKSPKKPSQKLGQAATLVGREWTDWMAHILQQGSCWLWVLSLLSFLFCLRVSEAVKLKHSDFSFRAATVHVEPLKKQKACRKPMLKEAKRILTWLKEKGLKRKRTRRAGIRGVTVSWDTWYWPKSGYLFPASRIDSVKKHRVKDTVCKTISRLRKSYEGVLAGRIRSHSARHSMINLLKTSGIPDQVGMLFARISDQDVYDVYGNMTLSQATTILKKNKTLKASLTAQCKGLGLKHRV